MEENNSLRYLIVKECCRSLTYDSLERQFSFPLQSASFLSQIWERIKPQAFSHTPSFRRDDFVSFLTRLDSLDAQYTRTKSDGIGDSQLLPGESLDLTMTSSKHFLLIKMEDGQYLNLDTGQGLTFGSLVVFQGNASITTAEGNQLGICKSVDILCPNEDHIILDRVFFKNYHRRSIGSSLWPVFNHALKIIESRRSGFCDEILDLSIDLGIGSFPTLRILNAATSYGL